VFESIAERFTGIFDKLRWGGKLTEDNIREGLREVRRALLEADVNVQVVREFLDRVTTRSVGSEVLEGVEPGHQVVQIVHDELVTLMGEADADIPFAEEGPTVILMAGLQGSGKTTTTAKLALLLKENDKKPLMVAADLQRPAAIEQLKVLGEQVDVPVFHEPGLTPPELCAKALDHAKADGRDVVILDTAGRLHVDDQLMGEVAEVHRRTSPHQTLLVVDAMTGQDAVNSAKAFHERLPLDGVVFTKLDGDTRGGAIVSLRHIISFVEKAQSAIDEEEAAKLEEKFLKNKFDLGDFATQLDTIRNMGSIKDLLGMIPGVGAKFKQLNVDESIFKKYMSIISSMTQYEKSHPDLIDMSRRRRIANGSGTSTAEVQGLLKQFGTMRKMMGKFGDMKDLVGKLPEEEELTPEQLANPQSFMPNPNRLFAKREDKSASRKQKQARKKKAKMKKKSKR
jgi:signal recognition particle subunit SRP54